VAQADLPLDGDAERGADWVTSACLIMEFVPNGSQPGNVMAYEFAAKYDVKNQPSLDKIESRLIHTHGYISVRSSGTEFALRCPEKVMRSNWPEDFSISLADDKLILTIYSATRQEHEKLVNDVESTLRDLGAEIIFEEI